MPGGLLTAPWSGALNPRRRQTIHHLDVGSHRTCSSAASGGRGGIMTGSHRRREN
jgi:hypothetical protein